MWLGLTRGVAAQFDEAIAHDLLDLALEVEDEAQLLVGVLPCDRAPGLDTGSEHGRDVAQAPGRVQVDEHPSAVLGIPLPPDEPGILQPVQNSGDRRRGEPGPPGQLPGRQVPAQGEEVQAVQVRDVDTDPFGRHLAEQLHYRSRPAQGQQELALQAPPRGFRLLDVTHNRSAPYYLIKLDINFSRG